MTAHSNHRFGDETDDAKAYCERGCGKTRADVKAEREARQAARDAEAGTGSEWLREQTAYAEERRHQDELSFRRDRYRMYGKG
jgi:hypothetical protein